jgi:hypothetical protein
MEQLSFVLGITHLSVILYMDPSMQPYIQEKDVPMTCRSIVFKLYKEYLIQVLVKLRDFERAGKKFRAV